MAVLASLFHVLSTERVVRILVVVKENDRPVLFRMARGASETKTSLVDIIGSVACRARGVHCFFGHWRLVAAFTFHPAVFSLERIVGLLIMIEGGSLPRVFGMAGLALRTKDALVIVILSVAGIAVHWGIREAVLWMTVFAFDLGVFAPERETGCCMVELLHIVPISVGVALFAGRAQGALMDIVFLVTGVALRRSRAVFCSRCMAVLALHRGQGMAACEGKIAL